MSFFIFHSFEAEDRTIGNTKGLRMISIINGLVEKII